MGLKRTPMDRQLKYSLDSDLGMNSVSYIGYIRYMNGHIDIKYIRIEYLDMHTVCTLNLQI